MKTFITIFFLAALGAGCAAIHPLATSLQSRAGAAVTIPPQTVTVHFAFERQPDWPDDTSWTNVWTVAAVTSPDLTSPAEQWQLSQAPLEWYHDRLTYPLSGATPNLFCRFLFQLK